MSHVAFDEVDLHPHSLCSGFPFIISAKFGKLYLWKGAGSGHDELGCARLIGMDLGLTGEIEEIVEGEEPASFFESFPYSSERAILSSSEIWSSKPNHEKYGCRLFRVEQEERPKSNAGSYAGNWLRRGSSPAAEAKASANIHEIRPFAQTDLDPKHIYVLDAFFSIYMSVHSILLPCLHAHANLLQNRGRTGVVQACRFRHSSCICARVWD